MTCRSSGRVRCAIYTRKSTEEGLDQSFNSLDAQREACEAYVRSQAGEGWKALPEHYDDGGYSGGNLDRPAMQRLLADIDAGNVDVIVVYKVDRLTRSLMDFARIVERLDARGVSFVSVTQAFNTTTSMGRLTLNVLLSFAQFEREVTGERIRDKIAASKAKGMWMGGNLPLGYDVRDRRLVVDENEAEQVRHIFSRYVELKSSVKLVRELQRDGVSSKRWVTRQGQQKGGIPFRCGSLCYLLQNRIYVGEVVHKGLAHAGDHEAIVSCEVFDAVQRIIAEQRQARRGGPRRADRCWLSGLARDGAGKALGSSFSYGRGGKLYRYYVIGSLDPSESGSDRAKRVPAAPLERMVLRSIGALTAKQITRDEVTAVIEAVELRERSIQVVLRSEYFLEPHESVSAAIDRLETLVSPDRIVSDGTRLRLIVDRKPVFRSGKKISPGEVKMAAGEGAALLRSAHSLLRSHSMCPQAHEIHAQASAPPWQRQRKIMQLGLLAPAIQKAILQGSHPTPVECLAEQVIPLAWADQIALHSPSGHR